ncbi:insulinase family protein [bacterium]|nr:insulinase family protein [bacterium]
MKRLVLPLLIITLFANVVFGVEDLPIFHKWIPDSIVPRPPVYHWTLDNGLDVLFWENHTVPVVNARILVKTGSAWEGDFLGAGISHYLEHIVSGGTTSRHTEDEYKALIREYSLRTNAFTTSDVTCYYGTAPAKNFDVLLEYLADCVQMCAFDSFEIARETGVILQEIAMGKEEPNRELWKVYSDLFYKVSSYCYPTIGYRENFVKITRQNLMDYYHVKYAPNNAILSIAGDLDIEDVKALVDSLWLPWERQVIDNAHSPLEPMPSVARVAEVEMDVEVSTMRIGFPTVYYGDPDLPALRILGMILSGVATSRLDLRLVQNDNPLMHSITAYSREIYRERGQFSIAGDFDYEMRDEILEAIWDEIDKVKNEGVRPDEVEWAKSFIAKSVLRENETVEGQTSSMMYTFLHTGKPFSTDFYLAKINRVTPEEVQQVARKYLLPENMIVAILKPIGATCASDSLLVSKKASGRPEFEVRTLDNGLKLVLAENPALPTVDYYMYMMGGAIFEPADKPGLAYFTSSYLKEGTKKYPSFEKLVKKMDDLGIQIDGSCGNHTMYLSSNFIATDFDEVLGLVAEMVFNPVFPERALDKVRNQQIASIKDQYSSWSSEAYRFFDESFYGEHPYAKSTYGVEESVLKLTNKDAEKYWESMFDPKRMVIAAAGPISVDEMESKIAKYFEKVKSPGETLAEIPAPKRHNAPELHEKEVSRAQVTLIIGFDGALSSNEKDKWALRAASGLLSGTGGLSGWLAVELRGKRDLVYISWASSISNLYGGRFAITAQCEPVNADSVKAVMLRVVDQLRTGDFTEEELKGITDAMAEQFVMARQAQSGLVSSAGLDELYGFGYDYTDTYPDRIKAVTKDDVVRVANEYLTNPVMIILKPAESAEK